MDIPKVKELSGLLKLPEETVLRLIDLVVYSFMEKLSSNPKVHGTFRRLVKKRLYIRCMKVYGELFKGKKQVLQKRSSSIEIQGDSSWTPFVWNSLLEGDELSLQVLREESEPDDFLT
jgi:hypothetical protein